MELTRGGIKSISEKLDRAKTALASMKEKGEEAVGTILQTAEVAGSAFGWAYCNVAYGGAQSEIRVIGLPADLAAGVGLHALALLGAVGKYGDHIHNLADGSLASYASRQGAAMATASIKAKPPGWAPAGAFNAQPQGQWGNPQPQRQAA